MKKVSSFILTLVIVVAAVPLGAFTFTVSAEEYTEGFYTYAVYGDEAKITDVDTSISGDITIPSTLGGYPVTSIGNAAFYSCSNLTSITIPNSVTSIGSAFRQCSSLTSITIPNSVTSIGENTFRQCSSLTSITIPDSVTDIGTSAFYLCTSLTSITIPNSVTYISRSTFNSCYSLTSITIPNSVTDIGSNAFYLCRSLVGITIPKSITNIGNKAFYDCENLTDVWYEGCENDKANISIGTDNDCLSNSTWHYNTYPGTNMAEHNYVAKVTNPTCTSRGYTTYTCSHCGDSYIDSYVNVADHTFDDDYDIVCNDCGTTRYIEYTISNGEATITDVDHSIGKNVIIPSEIDGYRVKMIGSNDLMSNKGAFTNFVNLESVVIPDSVTSIGYFAFEGCTNLKSITIPDSVKSIYICAFRNCTSIEEINLPNNGMLSIGGRAFEGCTSLKNINIPDGGTAIGFGAFYGCTSLKSITIPDGVYTIYGNAFDGCTSLTNITVSQNVTKIEDGTFNNCISLTDVWYTGSEFDKENMSIGSNNAYFKSATWHYNTCADTHVYDSDCDSDCNNCEWIREIVVEHNYVAKVTNPTCTSQGYTTYTCSLCGDSYIDSYVNAADHIYDNACDAFCNGCDARRTITHTYDNACDAECNICGYIRITSEHVYDDIYDTVCNVCGTTRQLTSISISVLPTKIVYAVGENFDNSGMVVNAYYSDGTSGVVTRYTVVGFDSSTAGTKIVNVTYGGRITQFAVTILALEFSGASLTLQNDITINYMVDKTAFDSAGYTNPYVEFEFNGEKTIKRAYSTEDGMYVFRFNHIIPSQINDTVKATLYAEYNGIVYSGKVSEYSVAKYCYTMLSEYAESDNAELKTLLVDLLNYGAAAQIYTDYNTDSLANASLTDEQAAWGTDTADELNDALNAKYEEIENPVVKWKSVGLNLKNSVSIRFKIAAESCDNLTVKVTSESGQEWTILNGDFDSAGNGCYYVYFENLSAYQMREKIYATVYDGDTAVSNTLCYSIESYAYAAQSGSNENLKNLLDAMIKYGDSAYNYKQSIG